LSVTPVASNPKALSLFGLSGSPKTLPFAVTV